MGGAGRQDGGVEAVQDLLDPCSVRTENRHELGGGHLLPLPGEERLQPQQVDRVPRGEHRQRAEQTDPGTSRTGLALGTVQSGQLVTAGGREHVALAADQLSDRRIVQFHGRHQLRIAAGQCGRVLLGDHRGRVGPPDHVVLGVLNDRLDGLLLGRCRGRQVMIAFDGRGVVRVDGRPSAA
jgi:hypothetical protein